MANERHLEILKKGVVAWNRWRDRNLEVRPDLSGVSLSESIVREKSLHGLEGLRPEVDLSGINFGNTDLAGANLEYVALMNAHLIGADLRQANLSESMLGGSDLSRADLSRANLRSAELFGANLHDAELAEADLSYAQLSQTIFDQTRLSRTRFVGSGMVYTLFGNVDLSEAKGLETVNHFGPSTIGIDTIYRSQGKIPEVFLRGAGVPEAFITYIKSLVVEPIEYYSCFISYSSKDEEFAKKLHRDLQGEQVRCWFAPEDMKIGDEIRPRIDEAIRIHDKLLIVLSENSVGSPWVRKEVETAFGKEIKFETQQKLRRTVLFPIRLDDAVMKTEEAWAADIKRTRHIGDFREWKDHDEYQKAFGRLLRDLKAGEKTPG